jgi:uncharacterized protein YcnI
MAKRLIWLIIGTMVMTLLVTTVAIAGWTPEDIYNDFVTNGKLTRDYTDAELQAYLNDATVAQYSDPDKKKRLDELIQEILDRDEYPFTGFQIAIIAIVVVVLIGGGIALRHYSRPQKPAQKS